MSIGTETGQRRRRPLRLTPLQSVPVEFTGPRAGEGPLTLGQLDIYTWLSHAPGHIYAILCTELPVPAVVSVGEVAAAAAALIARHETLRTSYVPGDPPRQRVAGAGVQLLEVCSLGEGPWGPQDRPAVAEALVQWLRESPDPGRYPVRMAVAIAPGTDEAVIACAAAFTHLAVDHEAIGILQRDFAALLGDDPRGPAAAPGHQPLDQAALEATPAERRRADAALDYLRDQFRRIPRSLYTLPGARPTGESLVVQLSSPAAAMAVRQIAARTRTSRSSIVLTALCAVLARRARHPQLVLPMSCSNRFEHHLTSYAGTLVQISFATIDTDRKSFDDLAAHTWTKVLEASRNGRYDAVKAEAMGELIAGERGLPYTSDPIFNSLVPESWSWLTAGVGFEPEDIDLALARTELRWRPMPFDGASIQLRLYRLDGCLRLDAWTGDTGLVPRAELESVLLAAERLLAAAARGDIPAPRMPAAIGLEPLPGRPDRILTDHCWVDIPAVQHLVQDAIAPAAARVFATDRDRPLVAYLTATGAVRTPAQAHARCLAALTRHPAAITPHHYVICPAPPADPADPADPATWPPPLAAGTGRT